MHLINLGFYNVLFCCLTAFLTIQSIDGRLKTIYLYGLSWIIFIIFHTFIFIFCTFFPLGIQFDKNSPFFVFQFIKIRWITIIGDLIKVLKPIWIAVIGEVDCSKSHAKELSTECKI